MRVRMRDRFRVGTRPRVRLRARLRAAISIQERVALLHQGQQYQHCERASNQIPVTFML